jgi:hypothetical protein
MNWLNSIESEFDVSNGQDVTIGEYFSCLIDFCGIDPGSVGGIDPLSFFGVPLPVSYQPCPVCLPFQGEMKT